MKPISMLSKSEFKELRDGYLEEIDIRGEAPSVKDALEIIRSDINLLLHYMPFDGDFDAARGTLASMVDLATYALTMDREAKEQLAKERRTKITRQKRRVP